MDCPYADCREWVTAEGNFLRLLLAPPALPKHKRTWARAKEYEAQGQTGNLTLEQWIEQVVPAYRGYFDEHSNELT